LDNEAGASRSLTRESIGSSILSLFARTLKKPKLFDEVGPKVVVIRNSAAVNPDSFLTWKDFAR
jgi:hypothetical protein